MPTARASPPTIARPPNDAKKPIDTKPSATSATVAPTMPASHPGSSRRAVPRSIIEAALRVRDLRDQRAVDVREPHVAAVEAVGQLRVIHAEQVQHRRVEVVIRDRLLHRLVAELVARADHLAAL